MCEAQNSFGKGKTLKNPINQKKNRLLICKGMYVIECGLRAFKILLEYQTTIFRFIHIN